MDSLIFLALVSAVLAAFLTAFAIRFKVAASVILVFALMCLGNLLYMVAQAVPHFSLRAIAVASLFIFGPSIWWLVKSQISGIPGLFRWTHWLPAPLALVGALAIGVSALPEFIAAGSLSRLIYAGLGGTALWRNRHALGERNGLFWLAAFVMLACWVSLTNLAAYAFTGAGFQFGQATVLAKLNAMVSSSVTALLLWWAIVSPEVYMEQRSEPGQDDKTVSDLDREIFLKLERAFADDLLFRDELLSLSKAAEKIAATPRELSNAVNRCAGQSFRAYLRSKRIAYVRTLLAMPGNRPRSVIDLALEAGFGTKSTFNDAFKAEVGMTPTAYRKQALVDSTPK